jgi:hypothetical protein
MVEGSKRAIVFDHIWDSIEGEYIQYDRKSNLKEILCIAEMVILEEEKPTQGD